MGENVRTRVEIVGALLREGKVTPEEAAVLLDGGQQQVFIPVPSWPYSVPPVSAPVWVPTLPNEPYVYPPVTPYTGPTIICDSRARDQ